MIDRNDVICLEGNGARPSHLGIGWSQKKCMFTLNSTEVHCVAYKKRSSRESEENDKDKK